MESPSFDQRVAQITDQVFASDPAIVSEIQHATHGDVAEWQRGRFRATLTLHTTEALPRLALQLFTGEKQHPESLQVGFSEADVVNMIAVPIAALLAGHGEG